MTQHKRWNTSGFASEWKYTSRNQFQWAYAYTGPIDIIPNANDFCIDDHITSFTFELMYDFDPIR